MKKYIYFSFFTLLSFSLILISCGKDDSPKIVAENPEITGFTPEEGPVGTAVTINGKNFSATAAANIVKIGTTVVPVTSATATKLMVTIPEGATTGRISITLDDYTYSSAKTFTVTEAEPTAITLNKTELELFTLDSETLSIVSGADEGDTITWSSADENIATIDENGMITALSAGSTTIKAMVGNLQASCELLIKPSVFAVGYEVINGIEVSVIWKNGKPTNLTDGTKLSVATSVFVYGTNIYVSGIESNQNNLPSAKVWKNGESLYTLSDENNYGVAHSIYVFDEEIFIAGSETDEDDIANATIWKNGVTYATLSNNDNDGSLASGIFVNQTNIYTAGHKESEQNIDGTAKLWTNTTQEDLTDEINHSRALSVYAIGSDVYVAGYEENENGMDIAKIWINGQSTDLTDGSKDAEAQSIFVMGQDVYVAGTCYGDDESLDQAVVWKNGEPTNLGTSDSAASSVYVYGNDIYVGGGIYQGEIVNATVWKNGVPLELELTEETEESAVLSIFVK
ncbi:IPT/TIG domain-containing protein [Flagellimonas sp.]|uniref:IPT/TIG domain-containing protein n=1 Tax=Flagellimonas sp. TaxID=2058762 RepID=UPI003B5BA219